MADAMISAVVERVAAIIEDQIRYEWNLVRGVEKELRNLSDKLEMIRNVLVDAEKRGVKEQRVKIWLRKLEDSAYEMDDILDEWNYTLVKHKIDEDAPKQKVCCSFTSSPCLCFNKVVVRRDIAKKIQNVKDTLDLILDEKKTFGFLESPPSNDHVAESWRPQSVSLIEVGKVKGLDIENNKKEIVSKLLGLDGEKNKNKNCHILCIVGMGGIGKTTLAQLVYNDTQIKDCFKLKIWICVSDPFDVAGVARGIVQSVTKEIIPRDTSQLELVLEKLKDCITGKKFLLVLDDVWTEDNSKWEPLKISLQNGAPGCKILVTTRKVGVAEMMDTLEEDIYRPKQLSDEECWSLMRPISLRGRKEEECRKLEDVGKKICCKCKGLPLAANVLGSLLKNKNSLEEWEHILESEIWELEKGESELFPHLLLSYNELSPDLKHCFLYCAVYPKDYEINVQRLIQAWMVLGYLGSITEDGRAELKGREYFNNLAMRSLFQDFEKNESGGQIEWCKMHDIVHDFVHFLRNNNGRDEMRKKNCQCVTEVQVYRSIYWDKGTPPLICDCLTSVRVLKFKWGFKNDPLPHGMKKLIHLRWLDLSGNKLSEDGLKIICRLYFLQTLLLEGCSLEEISGEIGNLVKLRHLDLSLNYRLKELPESMCNLVELQSLDITYCSSLNGLPEGIQRLQNLQHLLINDTPLINHLPQGVGELSGLRTLASNWFNVGSGCSKLGLLKKLNCLTGTLSLAIRLRRSSDLKELVEDAREAELKNKIHIQSLFMRFNDLMDEREGSSSTLSLRMDVIEALEPNFQELKELKIKGYKGSRLPYWMSSPLNSIKQIHLYELDEVCSLPAMGRLPSLEELDVIGMKELKVVGREFLGIECSSSSSMSNDVVAAFPKLRRLCFTSCHKWEEWEDITTEEEEEENCVVMPCLTELTIDFCRSLKKLPHRLLHKASSLQFLTIVGSPELEERYADDGEDSAWRSISQFNPKLQLLFSWRV